MGNIYFVFLLLLKDLGAHNFWTLGVRDITDTNVFRWEGTTIFIPRPGTIGYENWLSGEPGMSENCMNMRYMLSYGWNDAYCLSRFYYICQSL